MTDTGKEKEFYMTKEELAKFEKAFKNEKFRELLGDYVKEISDPENRKKYEEEIAQMERERGSDIKFVHPEGGFVVKTKRTDCETKTFINICYNENIKPATSTYVDKQEDGKRKSGYHWDVPFSVTHPRDDLDRAGSKCIVYDAIFHPDTYKRGDQDPRFKKLMIDTALDGIEEKHGVKIDKKNLKFPKMKFKGVKQATVIRTPSSEPSKANPDELAGGLKFPYPYSKQETQASESEKNDKKEAVGKRNSGPVEPRYRIVHRGHIDLQNFTNARDVNTSTRPKELVIYIDLPLLKSSAPVELDIFEKQLVLDCKKPASYHLDISLPYPVDEENGSAKFDKSSSQLIVTVPVQPPPPPPPPKIESTMQVPADSEKDEEAGFHVVTSSSEDYDNSKESEALAAEEQELNSNEMNAEEPSEVVQREGNRDEISENSTECCVKDEESAATPSEEPADVRFELPSYSEFPSPFFNCPPYTYHQDEDTVVFVVNVPHVALDTVSLGFNGNKCYISFPAVVSRPSSVLPPPDYALYVQFPEGHNLDPDLCKIDVSEKNLVLILHKDPSCKGQWECFKAGPGEEKLQDRRFVTEESVQMMMKEIAQQDPWAAPSYDTNVKVSSVKENFLELELESQLRKPESSQQGKQEHSLNHTVNMADTSVDVLASKMEGTHLNSSGMNGSGRDISSGNCATSTVKSERSESERSTDGEPSCTDEGDDQFSASELVARSIRTRKSCLRRTSSTSTDEEVELFSGSPDSPSKNVRFNLNHQIRVFSNKKDKKKRRLEQRIKAEAKKAMESAKASELDDDDVSGGDSTRGVVGDVNYEGMDTQTRTDIANIKEKEAASQPVLINSLMFELDD